MLLAAILVIAYHVRISYKLPTTYDFIIHIIFIYLENDMLAMALKFNQNSSLFTKKL